MGLVFIAPVLLDDYPPAVLSVGRYLAFGLIALPMLLIDRRGIGALTGADWREAAKLSLVGNLVYYACLAAAIQSAGAPLPTMIIGTLPVVIAVSANLAQRQIGWARLAGPLIVFETLSALGCALLLRGEAPPLPTIAGAALLVAGVLLGVRACAPPSGST